MARRKSHAVHANHERWLVSYADFITLLFAFFVVMFANSEGDKAKARQVSESVRQAFENGQFIAAVSHLLRKPAPSPAAAPPEPPKPRAAEPAAQAAMAELLPSLDYLKQELAAEIDAGKMQLSLEPRGLVISLREATFFPPGDDRLDPATYPILEKVALSMAKLPNPVRLEGHTDAQPIHNSRFRSNWELSAARSIAALELFRSHFGIPSGRLAVAGYADTMPVDGNDSTEGRARNRRVDIVILNQQGLKVEPSPSQTGNTGNHAHSD
jgi:chemotaxis protein MotB